MSSASRFRFHFRLRVLVVVACLCLSLALVAGAGVVGAQPSNDSDTLFQQSSPDAANASESEAETPRHQNPADVEEEGDLSGVSRWLSSELASSLEESSVQLSQGQYDQARETVGDDYDERLARYAEVARETGSESDQQAAREFEAAAENQREFTDAAEQYEATYDEYQDARDAGNEERARELARELQRLSEDIDESGAALEENYANLSETTEQDFGDERRAVGDERAAIESQQRDVQELEFVGTELTIDAATESISFTDPLVVEGRLATEDGEPIANEDVAFAIGEQTVTTTTDDTGAFTLTYRPTVLPVGTESLEIAYEPAAGSAYADASATVPVSVEQSDPAVTIESVTESVAFGDEITVSGTVEGSDGTGASNVPVVISLGEERLGEVETDSEGGFELTASTPGTVPAGEGTVTASLPLEGQALTSAETTATTTVEETETRVSATASETDADDGSSRIAVSGRLTTADDRAITTQPVRILVDGTAVTTVETDATGQYNATVKPPALAGESAEVTAVYDGAGTNLADAQASDTVSGLPVARSILDAVWWPGTILVGLGVVLLLWVYRSRHTAGATDAVPSAIARPSAAAAASTPQRIPAHVLLEHARRAQRAGETERAITLAYVAVRNHFATSAVPGWTHWEFYNETAAELEDASRETLLSVTEQFERAVFAPEAIPTTAVGAVIAAADRLVERTKPR